jgi:transcriptional regulator with XRE-family HTH domain
MRYYRPSSSYDNSRREGWSVGRLLRFWREQRGLTKGQLTNEAEILSEFILTSWESGLAGPSPKQRGRLADILELGEVDRLPFLDAPLTDARRRPGIDYRRVFRSSMWRPPNHVTQGEAISSFRTTALYQMDTLNHLITSLVLKQIDSPGCHYLPTVAAVLGHGRLDTASIPSLMSPHSLEKP